jgi:centrosomal protein CEP76
VTDSANTTKFKLLEATQWKRIQPTIKKPRIPFFLKYTPLDTVQKEIEMELELIQSIEFFRADHYMSCVWDEELNQITGQCLWSMEHSKISGNSISAFTDDFQFGIKRYIPDGHTFKGFPTCFNHMHTQRIFNSLCRTPKCKDILLARGDCIRFAVRVKIIPFSDNVVACWVMISCRSLV